MTQPQGDLTVGPLGDRAVLLTLAGDPDRCNQRIALIAEILREEGRRDPRPAILDLAPAMVSLAVFFDPRLISPDEIGKRLIDAAARAAERGGADRPRRLHVIPVVYDGPDLSAAAARLGLSPDELKRRHAARVYRVRFLGFAPGFAYLGALDPTLALPRLSTPRLRVAAGSVAIAGDQTAIYPLDTPGGWHLIGRTPVRPFDIARDPPSLFVVGDEVRFQPHPA